MKSRFWGAVLLVSGTTIGAGMLALPMTTGLAGFFPSLGIMTAVWLFMMLTAYYLLEVNLRVPGQSNLISMMGKTLGLPGQIAGWIIYLVLLYALMAAYMVGCSGILNNLLPLPPAGWPLLIFLIFATFVYFGTRIVDHLNRLLMGGLILAYVIMISLGYHKIQPMFLMHMDWKYLLPSLSVVLTTFGYHIIVPTLASYLDYQPKPLKGAIFIGSLIPFIFYMLWQVLVVGTIPTLGPHSLWEAHAQGAQVAPYLEKAIGNPWISIAVVFFSFFAIITSLLGVSLSLHDFLADGLKIKRSKLGKLLIILLTFFPPLFFALFYPHGFIVALEYAGICVAILLALFPALMVWSERYGSETSKSLIIPSFVVGGGKPLLVLTILLSIVFLGIELFI